MGGSKMPMPDNALPGFYWGGSKGRAW